MATRPIAGKVEALRMCDNHFGGPCLWPFQQLWKSYKLLYLSFGTRNQCPLCWNSHILNLGLLNRCRRFCIVENYVSGKRSVSYLDSVHAKMGRGERIQKEMGVSSGKKKNKELFYVTQAGYIFIPALEFYPPPYAMPYFSLHQYSMAILFWHWHWLARQR